MGLSFAKYYGPGGWVVAAGKKYNEGVGKKEEKKRDGQRETENINPDNPLNN